MSAGNIDLRFNAHTNLKEVAAQFKVLGRTVEEMQAKIAKNQAAINKQAQFDPVETRKQENNIRNVMNLQNELVSASGEYAVATRRITGETTKFNEQLARQKVRLRDVWGKDNLRMVRGAMKEQMALNNMMVRQFSTDATGRSMVDIIVPKNIDLKPWQNLRQQVGYYNQVLRSVSQETVNWGKNTQWAGRQLTVGFSVPISIAAGFMARFALEADQSLTRIAKVYGDTESAFQASNDSIKAMAQDTARYIADQYGLAAEETRNVMGELAATGLQGPELQAMTVEVQRTSLLGEMSSDESLKLLRTLKEVYGFSSKELREQVNYFNEIENSTALTMQDITEGLPRLSGIMKATGVSITEQTELLVAFKSAGIDIAEGANALKSINFKAVAATPTAANSFFRITGVEMQDLIDKTEGQFLPMMMEIANVMKTLENQEQVELIARVFGIHQGSRAITLLQQLASGSESLIRAQQSGMKTSEELARSADAELETIQESMAVRFKRLTESIKISMAELGKPVLDVIMPIGEKLAEFMEWFSKLPDNIKQNVARIAIILAASGPFVMLLGLFANLVGMGGRMIGFLVGLVSQFKILNPVAKAAELIQEKFETTTSKTTRALEAQVTAVGKLTHALEIQNRAYLDNAKAAQEAERAASAAFFRPYDKPIQNASGAWIDPNTKQFLPRYGPDPYEKSRRKAIKAGDDPKNWPISKDPSVRSSDVYSELHYPGSMVAAIEGQEKKRREELEKTAVALQKSKDQWNSINRTINLASMSMLGFASITGNEAVGNISMVAMGISSVLPLVGELSEKFAVGVQKMGKNVAGFRGTVAKEFSIISQMMVGGLGKVVKFLTGPWGIALGAAAATVGYFWNKHRKEVQETVDMYERLTDTSETLSQIYNYTPSTPLEREIDEGSYMFDENSIVAQRKRIAEMKEEQTEFYEDMVKYGEIAKNDADQTGRNVDIITKAIAEGRKVLAATGDPELAKRAAWDFYTVMSGEFMSFEEFKIKVKLDENSVDEMLSDVDKAGKLAAERIAQRNSNRKVTFKSFLGSGEWIDKKDLAEIEADVADSLAAIFDILDPTTQRNALIEGFGEEGEILGKMYAEALERGLIEEGDSIREVIDQMVDIRNQTLASNGRAGVDLSDSVFLSIDEREILKLQAVAQALDEHGNGVTDLIAKGPQWANTFTGVTKEAKQYTNHLMIMNKEEEIAKALNAGDNEKAARLRKEVDVLHEQAAAFRDIVDVLGTQGAIAYGVGSGLVDLAAVGLNTANSITNGMYKSTGATEDLGDAVDDTKDKLNEMSAQQKRHYDAFKSSAQTAQNKLVDNYVKQFQKIQDAEKKAMEDTWKAQTKVIEDRHERLEEAAREEEKIQQKSLDKRQQAEKKAMDKAHDAQLKAIDDRAKASKEAEKRENDALKARYDVLEKNQKKMQEARRETIKKTFDLQIERVRKQIEQEEALEKKRQEMYEAERERISRLQQMYSGNIDLNMAINTGDLDEAARIASSMNAQQEDWALQDLSKISSDASDSRKDALEKQIEQIEERKQAELDRIAEVEEAEKEALQKREDAEKAALDKKYERIAKEYEAEKEKQRLIQENLKEALANRHELERENLDKNLEAARKRRAANKAAELARNEEKIAEDRAVFEEQQATAKAAFDDIAEHWRQMATGNKEAFKKNNNAMYKDFSEFSDGMVQVSDEDVEIINKNMRTDYKQTLDELENEAIWEQFSAKIANALVSGAFGFMNWTLADRKGWILEGKLPKKSIEGVNDVNRFKQVRRHSGGVIGDSRYDKATGPGFRGAAQEVPVTALKGEGVLNLRAMRTPGVKDLMDGLNSGRISNPLREARGPRGEKMAGGRGGATIANGLGSVIPMLMRRIAEQIAITGMEVGANKAMANLNPVVDIQLGEKERQGLTGEQLHNAGIIVSVGRRMGASQNDILTALMTAMQESSLVNVAYGDDIWGVRNPDGSLTSSLGLFQQQKWWGSREDRLDPHRSSELFYKALFKVRDRDEMPLWQAAQTVQGSAFPMAYAKHESLARVLLGGAAVSGFGFKPSIGMGSQKRLEELAKKMKEIKEAQGSYFMPTSGLVTWLFGNRRLFAFPDHHDGLDIANQPGTPVYAAQGGVASNTWSVGGGRVISVNALDGTNHRYLHLLKSLVRNGQEVRRGQKIGLMGNTGTMTTGPHLHFEVRRNGSPVPAENFFTPRPRKRDYVTAGQMAGFQNGGSVGGTGFGDIVPAMLEPGEFVTRKAVANEWRPFLEAMNRGEVDFMSSIGNLGHRSANVGGSGVANSSQVMYNVNVEFSGNVNSEVDIERGIRNALRRTEKRKPRNRTVR